MNDVSTDPVRPGRRILHWIFTGIYALLVPGAMIALAISFFSARPHPSPHLTAPFYLMIIDPVPSGLVDSMLSQNRLPAFAALLHSGIRCDLIQRSAGDFTSACMELVTGKDASAILGAGIRIDPTTRAPLNRSFLTTTRTATILDIARWNHWCVITGPNDRCDAIRRLVVTQWAREGELAESYLERCDAELTALRGRAEEGSVFILANPMTTRVATHVFRINAWLVQNGFQLISESGAIDWSRSVAFGASSEELGIRINRRPLFTNAPVDVSDIRAIQHDVASRLKAFIPDEAEGLLCDTISYGQTVYPERPDGDYPDILFTPGAAHRDLAIDVTPPSLDDRSSCVNRNISDDIVVTTAVGGFVLMAGPPFLEARRFESILNIDIGPTVLFLMDIPVGRDMRGRLLRIGLSKPWEANLIRFINTWDRVDPRVEQPRFDEPGMERRHGDSAVENN